MRRLVFAILLVPPVLSLGCGSSSPAAPSNPTPAPPPATPPPAPPPTPPPTPPSDTTSPVCALTSPGSFTTGLRGAVTLAATATDDVGVAGVDFQLDGADLGTATQAPYTFTLPDTGVYAAGQHVFGARSRDAAGNASPWSQAVVAFGGSATLPAGFTQASLPGTLSSATALGVAPDGRIFVCEQAGALRIYKDGSLLAAPFATLPATASGERGLLGVTFDPAFAANGYVYVYYTATSPVIHNRVSRLTADPGNPDRMLAGSETILVELPALVADNHNGGALHFGPDGKLYVGVGENRVGANAPSLSSPLGKILRYNADGSIPTDNPFYGTATEGNRAIWALGLRNPFTFAFQPGTSRMHINDVGQATWEEVDLGAAGANYGWPSTEGPTSTSGFTSPLFAYGHSGIPAGQPASTGTFLVGQAILGAAFDPPSSTWPAAYKGSYYFGDLVGGWVARLHMASGNVSLFASGFGQEMRDLAFGQDGALYVLVQTGLMRISSE